MPVNLPPTLVRAFENLNELSFSEGSWADRLERTVTYTHGVTAWRMVLVVAGLVCALILMTIGAGVAYLLAGPVAPAVPAAASVAQAQEVALSPRPSPATPSEAAVGGPARAKAPQPDAVALEPAAAQADTRIDSDEDLAEEGSPLTEGVCQVSAQDAQATLKRCLAWFNQIQTPIAQPAPEPAAAQPGEASAQRAARGT